MKRFLEFRTLPVLAIAMLLPVAGLAAGGTTQTTAKATTAQTSAMHHDAASSATAAHSRKDRGAWKAKHSAMVDVNTASREELMALPGVSDTVAEKIIAGRPFKAKSELVAKQILTRSDYGKLRNRITAKPGSDASAHANKAPESTSPQTQTPESK